MKSTLIPAVYLILLLLSTAVCLVAETTDPVSYRPGKDYALFFAINEYQDMQTLNNPVKNARDLASELKHRYGFKTEVVTDPTFDEIEEKIAAYKTRFANGTYNNTGQLLVFFSGHGIKRGENGYFMPADGDASSPHRTGIEYGYLRHELDAIDCQHLLVAIDACHSATFDPSWKSRTDRTYKRPGEAVSDQIMLNYSKYRSRIFLTSDARGNQTPDRSKFAEQFLVALRHYPGPRTYLTSSILYANYLREANPTPGGGSFGQNDPSSCFLFFRAEAPARPVPTVSNEVLDRKKDMDAYTALKERPDLQGCVNYLRQFPNGEFRTEVAQLQSRLVEEQDWKFARLKDTREAYAKYLEKYPRGKYSREAHSKLPASNIEKDESNFQHSNTPKQENTRPVTRTDANGLRTITGIVTDRKGAPLIGATIIVSGTTTGTVNDIDGKFTLHNIDTKDAILDVSYVGYRMERIPVGESNHYIVRLRDK